MQSTKQQKKDAAQTLIKSLAHNEKKIRDSSVRVLQQWLRSKSEISEIELLKIWKALFFCMWHSDKPLVQQELAERLAKLISFLPSVQKAMLYLRTFFITIQREWLIIDRLRLNKYYTLIRKVVRAGLEYLRERQWEVAHVQSFVDVLAGADGPLGGGAPTGVALHVADLFLQELLESAAGLSGASASLLLQPFVRLLATSPDDALALRVRERLFEPLLHQFAARLPAFEPRRLADSFFSLASDDTSLARRRKQLYELHRLWASQEPATINGNGHGQQTDMPMEAEGSAANAPRSKKQKNKRKKQQEQNSTAPVTDASTPTEEVPATNDNKQSVQTKKRNKKKKNKVNNQEVANTETEHIVVVPPPAADAEVLVTPPAKKLKKQQTPPNGSTSSGKKRPPTPFKQQLLLSPNSDDGRLVQVPVSVTADAAASPTPTAEARPSPASPSLLKHSSRPTSKRKSVQFGGVDLAHFPKNSSPAVISDMRRAAMYDPGE